MRSKRIYGMIAALLAVTLGLGLIYLFAVGRIGAVTAIAAVLAMALLMVVLAALADMSADHRRGGRGHGRTPAHRP